MTTHPEFPTVQQLLPEPKRLWLEALRSDRFRQGKNRLATVVEDQRVAHCCLGVLCEVAIEAGVQVDRDADLSRSGAMYGYIYNGNSTFPPAEVAEWAFGPEGDARGWRVVVEREREDDVIVKAEELAALNDEYDYSFAAIADAIEESL